MADSLTPEERSARMAKVRQKNTSPELALRKELHRLGLRFRLHPAALPGRPDIVLPKFKAVVFVHGCFWHRHAECKMATMPKSNAEFWIEKFRSNVQRDAAIVKRLEDLGWRVFIVWQCEVAPVGKAAHTAEVLANEIRRA